MDFSYTHRLSDDTAFNSDWVEDVYYAERARNLVLETKQDYACYMYKEVPPHVYQELVSRARRGVSVGSYVNMLKQTYGPSKLIAKGRFTKVPAPGYSQASAPAPTTSQTAQGRTEVEFSVNGSVRTFVTGKTVDEALQEISNSAAVTGTDIKLIKATVYF